MADGRVVDRERLQAAKRACEVAILAAVNELERATGMEASRIELIGQHTVDGDTVTAQVGIALVLA